MSNLQKQEIDLHRVVSQHLSQLQGFGVQVLPQAKGRVFDIPSEDANAESAPESNLVHEPASSYRPVTETHSVPPTDKTVSTSSGSAARTPSQTIASEVDQRPYSAASPDRTSALKVLAGEVSGCTQCEGLAPYRTQTVFGVGNPSARLVMFGEAPGEQEDKTGEPFVGAAGQLLDKMLAACGLNRQDDVYILNTVKCRPPKNRNPKLDEISNCWGFTERQLDILQPEFICCLGSVAAKTLLRTTQSVGRLRKQFHRYRGSQVLVTYHPAYLLRTSSAKKHAWDDLQMLMKAMGISIPGKQ